MTGDGYKRFIDEHGESDPGIYRAAGSHPIKIKIKLKPHGHP